mmetsp:Transcript_6663/g.16417  ORF Transcript_6663/g.16417 Transcript_6663/m.16417 type:complete len:203 (+) Transcript_6663:721-1329(+)
MAPPIPFAAGVSLTSAPNALRRTRRSMDMDSGMVRMRSYPFEAATMARPMPVLPEVGSTRVDFPGAMSPRASASWIMLRAMRSFTELAGFDDSSLATISAPQSAVTLFSLTSGVWPMSSRMLDAIFGRAGVEKSSVEVEPLRMTLVAVPWWVGEKACAAPMMAEAKTTNFMVVWEWILLDIVGGDWGDWSSDVSGQVQVQEG